ncbi:hypothetical protein GCM10011510_11930 [Streptococcus himalayensis]|uniref:Uncharacterized protein n=1 Tax=Streptococcus himalayensis TaxID=1888195 RepID=A0A917EEK3_9STRE|nr:hypothetical protein GCM10011510_11930 [Streptococcus himalayensis]
MADTGYCNSFDEMMTEEFQCPGDISKKSKEAGKLFPSEGIVDRTLNHSRQLAKDVEKSVSSEVAFVK